jgi:putative tryptophan/tyrosine transport system substrate-binding protein
MRRRDLITLLGGAAAAWPLTARAQQSGPMRRIGVLLPSAADDPEYQARITASLQGLAQLGWLDGHNVRIDTRWAGPDADRIRKYAAELVGTSPDVLLATNSPGVAALRQATRTIPIVFVGIGDPVSQSFVTTLARPGGNVTGFTGFEFTLGGKWVELLKEVTPGITRATYIFSLSSVSARFLCNETDVLDWLDYS